MRSNLNLSTPALRGPTFIRAWLPDAADTRTTRRLLSGIPVYDLPGRRWPSDPDDCGTSCIALSVLSLQR